jgi:hypothetical protein
VPKSDSNVTWNATALASINAEVDTALNTAIPGSPTADSINERIVALDGLNVSNINTLAGHDPGATLTKVADIPTAGAIADQVWDEAISGHTGAGSTGLALSGASAPTAAAVADAVWDEALSGHTTAGTAGLALSTASSGGVDPSVLADAIWDEALSGHSTAGTTGKKLTDLVNADLSGVATAAALATVDGNVDSILEDTGTTLPGTLSTIAGYIDTEVAAILADTNELQTDLTNGGRLDLLIDAIKAKTDNLPASPAAVGSNMGSVTSVTGAVGSVTAGVTVTTNNDKTGYALSAAGVQAIWDALTSALTTVGSIGKRIVDYLTGDAFARLGAPSGASVSADVAAIKTDTGAIKTKTDYLPSATAGAAGGVFIAGSNAATTVNITGNLSGSVGSVTGAVGSVTGNVGGNVTGSVGSVTNGVTLAASQHVIVDSGTVTNLTNAPTSGDLTAAMKASVNAEVVDALATDTYAEPGQGAPSATLSIKDKIGYLFKSWRNKTTTDANSVDLYNDAGAVVDQKATISDDGTTFTRDKMGTGA